MSEAESPRLAEYLASHPRMIGALFMLLLLLAQAGTAAAADGATCVGP